MYYTIRCICAHYMVYFYNLRCKYNETDVRYKSKTSHDGEIYYSYLLFNTQFYRRNFYKKYFYLNREPHHIREFLYAIRFLYKSKKT